MQDGNGNEYQGDFAELINSCIEEMTATRSYNLKALATSDPMAKTIFLHHRDEEIEHIMISLRYLCEKDPVFKEKAAEVLGAEFPEYEEKKIKFEESELEDDDDDKHEDSDEEPESEEKPEEEIEESVSIDDIFGECKL